MFALLRASVPRVRPRFPEIATAQNFPLSSFAVFVLGSRITKQVRFSSKAQLEGAPV
jgi:hypothetical protein